MRLDVPPVSGSTSCPADSDRVFRVGGVALRVEPSERRAGVPVEHGPPHRVPERRRCDEGRLARMRSLHIEPGRSTGLPAVTGLIRQGGSAATRSGEDALPRGPLPPTRTRLGNESFDAPPGSLPFQGRVVHRLQRTGDGAEALGPLLV